MDRKARAYGWAAGLSSLFVADEVYHHAILGTILGLGAVLSAWRAGRPSNSTSRR